MTDCKYCKNPLPEEAIYCPNCGELYISQEELDNLIVDNPELLQMFPEEKKENEGTKLALNLVKTAMMFNLFKETGVIERIGTIFNTSGLTDILGFKTEETTE